MNLRTALDQYLQHLRAERNLAPRTIEAYRYDLERLETWLQVDGKPRRVGDVEAWDLKDYIATLKEDSNLKPTTLSRTICSIRGLFRWATVEGHTERNPSAMIRTPRKPKRLPIFMSAPEARRLSAAPPPDERQGPRDRAILLVLIMSGLRVSELVGLDLSAVDRQTGTLRVFGKGRKERLIPLSSSARGVIEGWLAIRPTRPGESALFTTAKGVRMTARMVQYLVRKAVRRAGLDPRISPHKLRHTFATHLYAQGTELRDIQELLGHANLTSTSIYTHTNVERLRDAVKSLSEDLA